MAESTHSDRLRRRLNRALGGSPPPKAAGKGNGRKRKTPGKMLRAKPPNIHGRGPLLEGPRLGVGVVAIVKNEADYLEEWLAYHLALSVDHFFIYDNGSTDGSAELLERYINHGLVTRIDWPLRGGQLAAYNHALRMFGATTEWLGYFDPDEFLVPLLDDDIPGFLARFPDVADVRVPRIEIGFSGHRTKPEGLTIDNYTHAANVLELDPKLPPRVKSLVRPRAMAAVDVHLAFPADVPSPGLPTGTAEAAVHGVAQFSHYYTRSWEEFEAKRFRGSATGRIARPAVGFDVPTIEVNAEASRFSERTTAMIGRLHELHPEPYQYGSQIGFEYYPRPNDLFRFSEFAVANYAAGLVEPRRFATIRLKNVYGGQGMITDISDKEVAPARDGLSTSHHAEALVDHMRGRIVNGLSVESDLPVAAQAGTLDVPETEPASLRPRSGSAELAMALPADEMLRCYTLGFLIGSEAPLSVKAQVVAADGTTGESKTFKVPAAASVAGVVEIQSVPVHGASLRLRVKTKAEQVDIYDLFVIANG